MFKQRSCPLLISLFLLGAMASEAAPTLTEIKDSIFTHIFASYTNGVDPTTPFQTLIQGADSETLSSIKTETAAIKTSTDLIGANDGTTALSVFAQIAAIKTETGQIKTSTDLIGANDGTTALSVFAQIAAIKTETASIKGATDLIGANDGTTALSVFAQIAAVNTAVGQAKTSADGAKTAADLLPPLIGVKYTAASGVQPEVPATGLYKEIKTNSEKIDAAQSSLNAQDGVLSTMDGKLLQSDTKHASIEAAFVNLYEDPQCPSEAEIKKVVTDAIPKPAADAAQHGIKATLLATLITFTAFA